MAKHCSWVNPSALVLRLDESFTLDSYRITAAVTIRLVFRLCGSGDLINDNKPVGGGDDGAEGTAVMVD